MIAVVAVQTLIIFVLLYCLAEKRQWRDKPPVPGDVVHRRMRRGPKRFVVERTTDVTGVSGTGVVVEGVVFSDGYGVSHFLNRAPQKEPATTVWHLSWRRRIGPDPVTKIHGHDGASKVVWLDE